MAKLKQTPVEFFKVDVGEVQLDGWMIKPHDFDPQKRYPVLFYVYGEPWGQTVLDSWGGRNRLWHGCWRNRVTSWRASITAARPRRVDVRGARLSIARWASSVQLIRQTRHARLRNGRLSTRRASASGAGAAAVLRR